MYLYTGLGGANDISMNCLCQAEIAFYSIIAKKSKKASPFYIGSLVGGVIPAPRMYTGLVGVNVKHELLVSSSNSYV